MHNKATVRKRLQELARKRFGAIYPVHSYPSIDHEGCFTEHDGKQVFWFNTEDQSSHLIHEKSLEAKNG